MKTVDEPNTMTEPQSIDVWDDNMGWSDIEDEDYNIEDYWMEELGLYSCGCCTCCGCTCMTYEDEEED